MTVCASVCVDLCVCICVCASVCVDGGVSSTKEPPFNNRNGTVPKTGLYKSQHKHCHVVCYSVEGESRRPFTPLNGGGASGMVPQ